MGEPGERPTAPVARPGICRFPRNKIKKKPGLVWLPGGLAAAGEGAGERVGETLHPAIRLLVEVVRARCSVASSAL